MALSLARSVVIWFAIINFCYILQAKSELRVGPWGGRGGDWWTYEPKGAISQITVTYDDVVHSICFTSIDENGYLAESEFPCKEARKTAKIHIDVKTEKLNSITGTFRAINKCSKTITSLSFTTTNNKTYGPFGTVKGKAFSLVVEDGEGFSGFHGSTGYLLDSIGVSLVIPPAEDLGPWGGDGGDEPYDYITTGKISRMLIKTEGGIPGNVHSITLTSKEKNGSFSGPTNFGGPIDTPDTIDSQIDLDVDKGEKLVGISGTYGIYHSFVVVTSLKFYTNKGRSFGPFGGTEGTPFSYKADQNKYIAGFYGRDGGLLDSIGVHVRAEEFITFGEWGTTTPGNAWTYQPNGAISHISITYTDAIYSIKFASVDPDNGTIISSNKFGTDIGRAKAEIDIAKNEKLKGISGTVGAKRGWNVITSLTFFTNKNRTLGPYGIEKGTAFSVPLKHGFISGFHGGSGKWLEAIGVFAMPAYI